MRNIATSVGVVPLLLQRLGNLASRSAMARVTRADLRAGSSESGSLQIVASRVRISGFAQVFEIDAERLAIRELIVGFPVAAEIGVDLEAMADIADDDEGGRLVPARKQPHIVFGLPPRVEHQHVPRPRRGAPPARLRLGFE